MRHILPLTVFVRLSDLGENVLPAYTEQMIELEMTDTQRAVYSSLTLGLRHELRLALAQGDRTLMGVVLNALLAWPDCCFEPMEFRHPRSRKLLADTESMFGAEEWSPKELELLDICKTRKAQGRKVLVYSIYTQTRDTTGRLKRMLEVNGFKVALLKSSVPADKREDWLLDQVDRGVDVVISNPELVKTGLDMLAFPTIVFMQTGFNVYTVQQAARRSWRIGQTEDVEVLFLGYKRSTQTECLKLMATKIAVSQSTSGDMPDTGLDILNQDDGNIETALAKQLLQDPSKLDQVHQKPKQAVQTTEPIQLSLEQLFDVLGRPEWQGSPTVHHHDIHVMLKQRFAERSSYRFDPSVKESIVWGKLFDFAGSGTWYVTEYNPKTKIGFGYVTGLACDEWGSFSIEEMQQIYKFGKPCIEFDLYFRPTPFNELKEIDQ
jgi:hypothetical protein